MNKLRYLSEEKIDLQKEIDMRNDDHVFHMLSKQQWDYCPISFVENNLDWDYFIVHLKHSREIVCEKGLSCDMRKIQNGMFKGGFCIVEKTSSFGQKTKISVIHKDGVLKFPDFANHIDIEKVDAMFSYESVVELIATLMTRFDVSSRYQLFESFCDGLPKNCWKDYDFPLDIVHCFNMKEVQLDKSVNPRYVRTDTYREDAKSKILEYYSKNRDFDDGRRKK